MSGLGRGFEMRSSQFVALALLAVMAIFLASALALSQTSPPAPSTTAPPKPEEKTKKTGGEEEPKIVRWVCTDRICGGCDGQCSRHGHVAVSKTGHCACTPNQGSALDDAIRKAFRGHEKGQ